MAQTEKLMIERADGTTEVPTRLGERVKQIRQSLGWTLERTSQSTGLARSTLSKIENDQMSPTYDALQKLAAGFEMDITELFVAEAKRHPSGRRAITKHQAGRAHPTPTYSHELLCHDMANKRMLPFRSRISARSFDDFEDWSRHKGEEFIYVLVGEIEVFTEFYESIRLTPGDSIYFDSEMGHACISISEQEAEVLWVSAA